MSTRKFTPVGEHKNRDLMSPDACKLRSECVRAASDIMASTAPNAPYSRIAAVVLDMAACFEHYIATGQVPEIAQAQE